MPIPGKFGAARMDVMSGITAGVLRLGIAQGDTAYVEVADSGVGSTVG